MSTVEYATSLLLAGLTAGGGLIGWTRSSSVPSLVAGLSIGTMYAYAAYRYHFPVSTSDSFITNPAHVGFTASLILAGSSFPRAIKQLPSPNSSSNRLIRVPVILAALASTGLIIYGSAILRRSVPISSKNE